MVADKPDTTTNTKEAARAAVASVNVMLPATVVSYNEVTQTASIRVVPCFRRMDPSRGGAVVCYRPPTVSNVPVAFPGAGDYSITWPLEPGDSGMLMVADRSIDEWAATGADSTEPQDTRRHDLSDGIFVPGLRSPASPLGADAVDSSAMVLRAPEIKLGSSSASDAIALATKVAAELQDLRNMFNSWAVLAGDGGAALKTLWTTLAGTGWPADTGSTKVKAE